VSNIDRKRVNGSVLYDNLNIQNKIKDFTKIYMRPVVSRCCL